MIISNISLSKDEIESLVNEYNESYDEIVTRVNILQRIVKQLISESEHTLI